MDPEVIAVLTRLGEVAARNTAGAVYQRIQTVRARRQDEATANELVDIINELVDEKTQLISIARSLESELVAQRISDEDLTFITDTLIPALERVNAKLPSGQQLDDDLIEIIKDLLTKETLTVAQLIGFNFKAAIGQPLTELTERAILAKVPTPATSDHIAALAAERELAVIQLVQNPEAYARMRKLYGHEDD